MGQHTYITCYTLKKVIVCQGDSSPLSTNKQHSKRWRKGDSLLFNPDQDLQRRQLGKTDQRHKYNMPYDEVIKNAEANVSKKGKEPTRTLSKPTYLSTTLSYGKLRTPILRVSVHVTLNRRVEELGIVRGVATMSIVTFTHKHVKLLSLSEKQEHCTPAPAIMSSRTTQDRL